MMIRLGLKKKIFKSLINKPNSKVLHLALLLGLGNEDHHATPLKR